MAPKVPQLVGIAEIDNRQALRRLLQLVWPYRWYLVPAFLCMAILAATNGALAYLVQPILDKVFISQDKSILYSLPLMVIVVFTVRGAVSFTQEYLIEWVGNRIVRALQVRLYQHLLTLELQFFLSNSPGSLISRVNYDTQMLKRATTTVISGMVEQALTVIALVGVLIYRDPPLAAMALIGLPLAGFLIVEFGRRMRRYSRIRQELMEVVTNHLEETFANFRIVKAFGMEALERAGFRKLTKKVLANHMKAAVVDALSSPMMDLVAGFAICGVILYGGNKVISGETTTGAFFSFLTALMMTYAPIKRLSGLNNSLQQSIAATRRIFGLLERDPGIRDLPGAARVIGLERELAFDAVSFAYEPELPHILREVNLVIRKGEKVALVGRSGSGKSTLVNLIPRFFDVSSGRMLIDGIDVREVTMASLRRQIALVTQETILFNDSVYQNVLYGSSGKGEEDVRQALEVANAWEFVSVLPQGWDTVIGDRGVKLSGGQRQRLSIARAVLKDTPILLLDEATSSLDSESERAVQTALERLMVGRTTVIIAHRLSTIRTADRIVVLNKGVIVEEGNHEQLIALNGEYARLHHLQTEGGETDAP